MRVRDFWRYYIYAYTRRNWLSSPAHSHTHTDTRRHPQILTQLQSSLFVRWFELGGLIALIVLIARQSPVAAATKLDNCGSGGFETASELGLRRELSAPKAPSSKIATALHPFPLLSSRNPSLSIFKFGENEIFFFCSRKANSFPIFQML